jgi:hypothetical protein
LLTDQDETSNIYKRPPIDAPYQASVHLVKRRFDSAVFLVFHFISFYLAHLPKAM